VQRGAYAARNRKVTLIFFFSNLSFKNVLEQILPEAPIAAK
jgi:hypothetical protein